MLGEDKMFNLSNASFADAFDELPDLNLHSPVSLFGRSGVSTMFNRMRNVGIFMPEDFSANNVFCFRVPDKSQLFEPIPKMKSKAESPRKPETSLGRRGTNAAKSGSQKSLVKSKPHKSDAKKSKNSKKKKNRDVSTPKKKPRDPSAPKRASNAYMIFCKESRARLKEENPGLAFGKIGAKLGEIWRDMQPEEKRPYQERAARDRQRYKREMQEYPRPQKKQKTTAEI